MAYVKALGEGDYADFKDALYRNTSDGRLYFKDTDGSYKVIPATWCEAPSFAAVAFGAAATCVCYLVAESFLRRTFGLR